MTVLLVLVGLSALDSYIFGAAMPRVIADLGGFDRYASVTSAYLLTSTLAIAVTGKMSEHYGRKPFLLAGVAGAMSTGFFAVERRNRDPIIGLDLLQQRAGRKQPTRRRSSTCSSSASDSG